MAEQDSFIDGRRVTELTGLSKATRRRQIQSGRFPAPVVVGTKNLWSLSEVSAWQAAKFSERDQRLKVEAAKSKPLEAVKA